MLSHYSPVTIVHYTIYMVHITPNELKVAVNRFFLQYSTPTILFITIFSDFAFFPSSNTVYELWWLLAPELDRMPSFFTSLKFKTTKN